MILSIRIIEKEKREDLYPARIFIFSFCLLPKNLGLNVCPFFLQDASCGLFDNTKHPLSDRNLPVVKVRSISLDFLGVRNSPVGSQENHHDRENDQPENTHVLSHSNHPFRKSSYYLLL